MNISIKATHLDLTPAIKKYIEEKVGNLGKFVETIEAKVEIDRDQHHHRGDVFRAEVMLIMAGKLMRAEAEAGDIYAAVDIVIPKLKEQIGKFKDKKLNLRRKRARLGKSL